MGDFIDITGQRFGKWTVIEKGELRNGKKLMWKCRCDCGTVRDVCGTELRKGRSVSCGCSNYIDKHDISGQRFGRLTAISRVETDKSASFWLCKCDCGNEKVVSRAHLVSGNIKSCGCGKNSNFIDLTGMRFGKLTVAGKSDKRTKSSHTFWACVCDCGNEIVVDGAYLRNGTRKSCGCDTARGFVASDLTGSIFGRLTVSKRVDNRQGRIYWECVCDCGNVAIVSGNNLRSGKTKSCGCLADESRRVKGRNTTHGMTNTRLYSEYRHMHNRCKPDAECRRNYYDKGVRVCEEWHRFEPFMEWALNKSGYRDDLTLDRIDSSGNYEPSNCRWATTKQQGNNKSTCVYVTIDGEKKTLKEWSEILGISYHTVQARRKRGYPEDKLFAPPFSYRVKKHG